MSLAGFVSFLSFVAENVPELVAWGAVYELGMVGQVAPRVERYCKGLSRWEGLKTQKSTLFGSAQVEVVMMTTMGLHHIVSAMGIHGGLRSGFLCELGFELVDVSNLYRGRYPYQGLAPEKKLISYRHHAFGILCTLPVLFLGLEGNEHVLAITGALLLGGGLLALSAAASNLTDADRSPFARLAQTVLTSAFVLYTRFVVFPLHYARLCLEQWDYVGPIVSVLLVVPFLFMASYNVPLIRIFYSKTRSALDECRLKQVS